MRLLIVTLILSFMAFPALACQCQAPSAEQGAKSYKEANIVVLAKVQSASQGFSALGPLLKLEVLEVIKGHDVPDLITANYNSLTAACGNEFNEGEDYIIALYDTRSLTLNSSNVRGYGFRVMISCHQEQIRYYLDHLNKQKTQEETE